MSYRSRNLTKQISRYHAEKRLAELISREEYERLQAELHTAADEPEAEVASS